MDCKHVFTSTTLTLRHGKNRRGGTTTRAGYVCAECRLVAAPPKSEKRVGAWKKKFLGE